MPRPLDCEKQFTSKGEVMQGERQKGDWTEEAGAGSSEAEAWACMSHFGKCE